MNKANLLIFIFAIFANLVIAQSKDSIFDWKAEKKAEKGIVVIAVSVKVPVNYYLYEDATKIQVESSNGSLLTMNKFPSAEKYIDEFQQENRIYKAGEHEWSFNLAGEAPYKVKIRYQGCSKSPFMCYPPGNAEFVIGGGLLQKTINSAVSEGKKLTDIKISDRDLEEKLASDDSFVGRISKRGGWWIFFGAFLGGILSTLTPCVLPLVPITVAILSGGDKGKKSEGFLKVLAYVVGIIVMFTALATVAAFSGKAFGSQFLGNQIFIIIFSLIFFLLSLSMLGLYDLQLPPFLQTKLSSFGGGGLIGGFLMGLVAGLIAVPCTGPVLGVLLGIAAASANPFFSISLLFSYACGFGLPFLFIASGAKILPQKSGLLMESVKSMLGIAIMILAVYGFSIAIDSFRAFLSDETPYARILSLFCLIAGFLFGAVHADGHSPNLLVKIAKIVGAILIALGFVWNLAIAPLTQTGNLNWLKYEESIFKKASDSNRYILLDFGADWCAACKEMDLTTFKNKDVIDELSSKWITVKIDCTVNSTETEKLIKEYSVKGFPGFVVLSPDGKVKSSFTGYSKSEEFLKKIRQAKEKK